MHYVFACLIWFFMSHASTIFQLNRDRSSWVEPVLSKDNCVLLKDHNAVKPVRFEPAAPGSWVKHSTTEPLPSLMHYVKVKINVLLFSSYPVDIFVENAVCF